jgi:dTDP-4-dehydrorhamnose reductase
MIITGSTGILGKELLKMFPESIHPTHEELEISDREAVFSFMKNKDLSEIIHTAALTGVRECEEDRIKAWNYNVHGTQNLVDACLNYCPNAYFVYVSTACVFDGHRGMYNENDIPYPENFYSLTKLLGEFAVKRLPNYLIIRTNFVARGTWRYPKAFTDRYGTYLLAQDVASGIKSVAENRLQDIVHIVGASKISMFELAKKLSPSVEPMTIKDYKGPPLTMDMSLDTVRWKKYNISV